MPRKTRSGFAALIGCPNVGKSTLLNRMVGEKLAIVSPKPQTTRTRIMGVVTRPRGQVALVDTPGIHTPKRGLNRLMVDVALRAIHEVDLVMMLIEPPRGAARQAAGAPVGREDRLVLEQLRLGGKASVLVINKIDRVEKPALLPLIDTYRREFEFLDVMPVSARSGDGVDELVDLVIDRLPQGPLLFAEDMLTDQSERALVGEYVREQVLLKCRQEVPHSTAVQVDIFDESDRGEQGGKKLSGLVRIEASIYVERESQKAIIIGRRGQMLKEIGTGARESIERLLGAHVYLSLRVRVEPRWSERPAGLRKLGYE